MARAIDSKLTIRSICMVDIYKKFGTDVTAEMKPHYPLLITMQNSSSSNSRTDNFSGDKGGIAA